MKLERIILRNLFKNDEYLRRVLPFLKEEYFTEKTEKLIFNEIKTFSTKYNSTPSISAISIAIQEKKNLTQDEVEKTEDYLQGIESDKEKSSEKIDWLIEKSEKFCQEKAVYLAVLESITILEGKDKVNEKGNIPKILSDALAVTFDNSIGHDYFDNADDRFKFYHQKEEKIPFDLEYFNKITKGGLPRKTLNIILAGTGVGKTLAMCHMASGHLSLGKNVLYITMEMSEERIAERIDANLLNVNLDDLIELPKENYDKKISNLRKKTIGKLIVKEYPTASASVTHFRNLVNELKLKKNFIPDVIFIDYLNICMSSRLKMSGSVNSYTYVKSIAEELRGFAVEQDVPLISATQTTRSGFDSSDVGLTDTSESFGLPATADFMFALISSEELDELGQIMVKQLKNRYGDLNYYKRFTIGIERSKMRLYDIEQSGQENIDDSGYKEDTNPQVSFGFNKTQPKKNFEGFKI